MTQSATVREDLMRQAARLLIRLNENAGDAEALIARDAFIARVRVTSGRHAGAEGWLSSEFVSPPR